MKKTSSLLIALFAVLLAGAQTADDVIAKYVDALGGLEKVKSIQSLYMEGVAVGPNGSEITTTTYKVQGKLYRQEIDFGMGKFGSIITDKGGWVANPRNGGAYEAAPAEMVTAQQTEMDCTSPLIDYAAKGYNAELIGQETIDGKTCYNIKLTNKAGKSTNYFIENKEWHLIRSSTKGGGGMFGRGGGGGNRGGGGGQAGPPAEEMVMNTDYSDFKKTKDGFVYPATITRPGMGGRGMATTIEKYEVNIKVDPKLFQPE
jgi:outer membrane lipoprotein-sorting protein